MLPGEERRNCDQMMVGGLRDHVDGLDRGMGADLLGIGKYQRPTSKKALDFGGTEIGALLAKVADGHQIDVSDPALIELLVAQDVAVAHAAASD